MAHMWKEEFKVYGNVFDRFTLNNLFKLQSEGHFEELESPIAIGKEGNIFTAVRKDQRRIIVKIYRLETCDFNKMYDYIKYDPRYSNLRKLRRKVVFVWTQREFRNLNKAQELGIRVPKPITFMFNILLMEFIGKTAIAPKVKDKKPKDPADFLEQVIDSMRKLNKAGLVHGDLSEFNILNFDEKAVFIDLSQCSPYESPLGTELLIRDTTNISHFFRKLGVKITQEELMKRVIS